MKSSNLIKTKKKLLARLEKLSKSMMIGSLYETTVNCKIESCAKCKGGQRGHKSYRLSYKVGDKKQKVAYVRKDEIGVIEKARVEFEEVKKIIAEIGEINFLLMKEKR